MKSQIFYSEKFTPSEQAALERLVDVIHDNWTKHSLSTSDLRWELVESETEPRRHASLLVGKSNNEIYRESFFSLLNKHIPTFEKDFISKAVQYHDNNIRR